MKSMIRKAKLSDLEYLHKIETQKEVNPYIIVPITISKEKSRERLKRFVKAGNLYVYVLDGVVVGEIGFYIHPWKMNHCATISPFAVDKKYWEKGIGTKLLEFALKKLKDKKRIDLEVTADNRRAISLYKKFNFKVEGILKKRVRRGRKYFDGYIMGRVK